MNSACRSALVTAALAVAVAGADAAVTPSAIGHWEGAIHAPTDETAIALDVALDVDGKLVGTFSNPSQQLHDFPLRNVMIDAGAVTLELKTSDPGVQTFLGTVGDDGRSMRGEFCFSVYSVPFSLTRTGDARIPPAPRSPAVDARLVGHWKGALVVGTRQLPLLLTLTNEPDAMATGRWTAGDAVATPVAVSSDGLAVTLTSTVTPADFRGTVNSEGTEIAGTMTLGGTAQPLTFVRSVDDE